LAQTSAPPLAREECAEIWDLLYPGRRKGCSGADGQEGKAILGGCQDPCQPRKLN